MGEWGRACLEPVDDLRGIGAQLAAALGRLGLGSVQELASLRPGQVRAVAEVVAGISPDGLRRAVLEARFHLVGPDGRTIGADLVDAGITSLLALVGAPTQRVVTIGGAGWDLGRAAALQVDAARAGLQFTAVLHVVDQDGAPIPEPRVEATDSGLAERRPVVVREGDGQGWVVAPPLRRDKHHALSVIASGHRRVVWVAAPAGPVARIRVRLAAPPRRGPVSPATTVVLGPAGFLFDEVGLGDARDGEVLRVGSAAGGEVRLLGVVRSVIPAGVVTRLLRVPPGALPTGSGAGSFVVAESGALRLARDEERDTALASRGGALAGRLQR